MAEEFLHDPNTGQVFYNAPGNRLVPVDQDQIEQIRMGGAESFLRSAGEMASSSLRTAAMVGSAEGYRTQSEILGEQARNQQARGIDDPGATFAGQATGFLADAAVPIGIPGGPVGAGAARIGAGMAARGAGRAAVAVTPQPILNGVRRGREIAQSVTGRVRSAVPDRFQTTVRPGEGAARGVGADATGSGRTVNSARLTEEQADTLAMPLTNSERDMLRAYEAGDPDAVAAANQRLANDDMMAQTSLGRMGEAIGWQANRDKKQWFTHKVLDEAGAYGEDRATYKAIQGIRDDAKEVFTRVLDNPDNAVDVVTRTPDGEAIDVLANVRALRDDLANVPASVERAIKRLEDAAARGEGGKFDSQAFLSTRADINTQASKALQQGATYDTGTVLQSIGEILDDAIEASIKDPVQLAEVQTARKKWKIKKVLERTAGTVSSVDDGIINPAQFERNWRMMTPSYKNHARDITEFEQIMQTAADFATPRHTAGNTLVRGVANAGVNALGLGTAAAIF